MSSFSLSSSRNPERKESSHLSGKTMAFMKNLMRECNLPLRQQRNFLDMVENGSERLCGAQTRGTAASNPALDASNLAPKVSIKRVSIDKPKPGIRLLDSIIRSDAFNIPAFKPPTPKYHSGNEKKRLQFLMESNGKSDGTADIKVIQNSLFGKRAKENERKEEIDEMTMLVNEIKERKDWLKEMTLLGKATQYKPKIDYEVQERVNRLHELLISNPEKDKNLSLSSLLITK